MKESLHKLLCRARVVFFESPGCWYEGAIYALAPALLATRPLAEMMFPDWLLLDHRHLAGIGAFILSFAALTIFLYLPFVVYRARERLTHLAKCLSAGQPILTEVIEVVPGGASPHNPSKQLSVARTRDVDTATAEFEITYFLEYPPYLKIGDRILLYVLRESDQPVFARSVYLCLVAPERQSEMVEKLKASRNDELGWFSYERILFVRENGPRE